MKKQVAFLDEYGNHDLDVSKDGVSTHFIISSIIIDEDKLAEVEDAAEQIRKKFFQTGEMKSKNVTDNDKRRIAILEQMAKVDFHIFAVVVDKRKLISEGYKYKNTFYKSLPSIILRELIKTYPGIKILYDEHGGHKFMGSFIDYIKGKVDLFNNYEISFASSKSEPLIQFADMISGTLARCYDDKLLSSSRQLFMSIIQKQLIPIVEWPYQTTMPYLVDYGDEIPDELDRDIMNFSIACAEEFIHLNADKKDTVRRDQVSFVRILLFTLKQIDRTKYISTDEVLDNLNEGRQPKMDQQQFRNKVVGDLRDGKLIIASSRKGYKLPANKKDIFDFVDYSNHYIQPMVSRVLSCRNELLKLSSKSFDVLDKEEYRNLKILAENTGMK